MQALFPQTSPCACGRDACQPWDRDDDDPTIDRVAEPSSLDPLETSGQVDDDGTLWLRGASRPLDETAEPVFNTPCECFRHSGWASQRTRVHRALRYAGASKRRLDAFASCGSDYHVLESREQPGTYRLCAQVCRDRFCLPCGRERSQVIAANVLTYLPRAPTRFITLTLAGNEANLDVQLNRLLASFRRLKATDLWRGTQTGGVAFVELKRGTRSGQWHPHLHILAQGKFIDQRVLAHTWKNITGDSFIVDVRLVRDPKACCAYVTKYASKPLDRSILDHPPSLHESIRTLAGRRLVLTFGDWKGLNVSERPTPEKWRHVGSLNELVRRAHAGDAEAHRIIVAACGERAVALIGTAPLPQPTKTYEAQPPPPWEQLRFVWPD